MKKEPGKDHGVVVSIRVARETLDQAAELAKELEQDQALGWARHSRSSCLRLCLLEGLKAMRRRYGLPNPRGGRR